VWWKLKPPFFHFRKGMHFAFNFNRTGSARSQAAAIEIAGFAVMHAQTVFQQHGSQHSARLAGNCLSLELNGRHV
jgi:hypothetical protein